MHRCLSVDEILRFFACELVALEAKATAVSLACCCRGFEIPVLDVLWESQEQLLPLLKSLPGDVWKVEAGRFSFERVPTKAEWTTLRKHARRMRKLMVDPHEEPVAPDVLSVLQLHTANEPLLPKLRTFECEEAAEAFIPFIPLFLSHKTTSIRIEFAEDSPIATVAFVITRLSMLCSDLKCITLNYLPRDPVITEAVSEMLLACNRDILQQFCVDSLLTEDARGVVFQLPKLSDLWITIQGHTVLPPMALPNLIGIDFAYEDSLDWLQGLRGATLEKLEAVHFLSHSEQIGDLLEEFKSVALTTSIPATLLKFTLFTSSSWDPNYRSLLPFTQLKELLIEFSCDDRCSSRIDDDIIMDLARAMPKLQLLRLGGVPCETTGGITVKGLIALTRGCRHLSKLRIHFLAASLAETATGVEVPAPGDETVIRRQDCALTDLEVGKTPIPAGAVLKVAIALLQNFPRLLDIKSDYKRWEEVVEIIRVFRRIGAFVQHTGDALGIGSPQEWHLPLFHTCAHIAEQIG